GHEAARFGLQHELATDGQSGLHHEQLSEIAEIQYEKEQMSYIYYIMVKIDILITTSWRTW
ncbi:hypothetical protein ACJX0J_015094, partial [Zea mays]